MRSTPERGRKGSRLTDVRRAAARSLALSSAMGLAMAVAACGGESGARNMEATNKVPSNARVIAVTARKWSFDPETIRLQLGEPVVLELTSADVHHGFNLPEFGVRADAVPGQTSQIQLTPDKPGTFTFRCDYFCGSGHEDMEGSVVVE